MASTHLSNIQHPTYNNTGTYRGITTGGRIRLQERDACGVDKCPRGGREGGGGSGSGSTGTIAGTAHSTWQGGGMGPPVHVGSLSPPAPPYIDYSYADGNKGRNLDRYKYLRPPRYTVIVLQYPRGLFLARTTSHDPPSQKARRPNTPPEDYGKIPARGSDGPERVTVNPTQPAPPRVSVSRR